MVKALVIGGGGALGAITVGKLKARPSDYKYVIGVSTGALMALLVGCGDFDRLKEAYTSTTNKDVFDRYPLTTRGELSTYNAVKQATIGNISLGSTDRLYQLTTKWFTIEHWKRLRASDVEVIITVLNVTTGRVEFKSSKEFDYEEICRYVAAASSPELIGSLWNFDGWEYGDAGLVNLLPVIKATKLDVTHIDVYSHREFTRKTKNSKPLLGNKRPFKILKAIYRYIIIMRDGIEHAQLREGVLRALVKNIEITGYFLDSKFAKHNSFNINKQIMTEMYNHGYTSALNNTDNVIKFTHSNWESLFDQNDDE